MKLSQTIAEKILDILQSGAETSVDLLEVFSPGYSESYKKLKRGMLGKGSFHFKKDWADMYRERQIFYSLLNRLKRQDLIIKEIKNRDSIWRITKKGIDRLHFFKNQGFFSLRKPNYPRELSSAFILITFDIPEKERQKRKWLCFILREMKFSLLQKSVWIGKTKIPEQFIHDLKKRDMLDYVHIIEINKKGTILKFN